MSKDQGFYTPYRNTQTSPNGTGSVNNNTTIPPKKKNKGLLIAATSIASVLIIILLWCFINHSNGNKKLEEGNYSAALAAFQKDFLFSSSEQIESAMLAGEAAFASQDYTEAISFFAKAGIPGKERWSDAIYEQARVLINLNEPDNAIQYLNKISEETRAQEQIGVASLIKAEQQYADGNIELAIQTAQEIQNTKFANVVGFLDMVYRGEGKKFFEQEEYQSAREAYEKCVKDSTARTNAKVLKMLSAKNYYNAAVLASNSIANRKTDLSKQQWITAFDSIIGFPDLMDISKALLGEAAKAVISDNSAFGSASTRGSFANSAPRGAMVGSYSKSSENEFVVDNLNDLYSKCGKNPNGKILIIAQRRTYPDREATQAILFSLMKHLPSDYYPSSLDEVEYIVFVGYDYIKEGYYELLTTALRENATVTVLRAPGMKQIYKSKKIDGYSAPHMFRYYDTPPTWKSGDAPQMGEEIYSAISSIIE